MGVKKIKVQQEPFVIILFFLFMGIVGIWFKEPGRVLEQACQVCLSCIGIG